MISPLQFLARSNSYAMECLYNVSPPSQNKVMVSRLHGALAPDLEAAVHDNAPGVSEADE